MRIDRARARAAFASYTDAYDPADPKIRLKIDHTYRVAALCDRIAADAGLRGEDADLAWLCGLLHDVGRFEQVRRYGTFSDAASVGHAALGVEVLFDEKGPDGLSRIRAYMDDDSCDGAIRSAVGTHSDFRLPAGLDARTRVLCDVLRDADKVDILKAICEADIASVLNVTDRELRQSALSPAVPRAFYEHRTVRRDEREHPADVVLSYACFLFEMVYPASLRAACEQGYAFELLAFPFERADVRAQAAGMAEHLRGWLAERGVGAAPAVEKADAAGNRA